MTIYYAGPKEGHYIYSFLNEKSVKKYTPKNLHIKKEEF